MAAYMLIHLRMSGRFEWAADHEHEPPHVRSIFELDDGNRLWFCDARKFGRIIYTTDLAAATSHLGVEPLERGFTSAMLEDALATHKRQIKPLLLDQTVIAGLGNIYADEALFHARLHPMTPADRLVPRAGPGSAPRHPATFAHRHSPQRHNHRLGLSRRRHAAAIEGLRPNRPAVPAVPGGDRVNAYRPAFRALLSPVPAAERKTLNPPEWPGVPEL